jgi:PPIC-type PPIASE domain
MKRSLTLSVATGFVAAGCATYAWSQAAQKPATPSAPQASTSTSESSGPKGPEAVASSEPSKVVATVNGKQITAKQAYDLLKMVPADQRRSTPNLQRLFEQLYVMNELAKQAEQEHLDQDAAVKSQLELSRSNVLAQAYMNKLTVAQSGGAVDAKQYYDSHKDEFDTAKLSGIAIAFNPPGTPASPNGPNRTEQEAQQKADDVEKKIKAGGDITALARTESDDQRSAAQGGSLGTLSASQPGVPKEIKDAVFGKLQAGQISEPIRMPNAFYIIRVDSRTQQPYEQARESIEQKLKGEKTQAIVKQEVDKYKVEVADPAFFNVSATSSAAPKIPSLNNPGGNAAASSSSAKK